MCKQIGSYVGLIPKEDSSAGHQRLGHISKQGNALLRYLLGEAAQAAARCDVDWRRRYASGDAAAKKYRRGGRGPQTRSSVVLDVAERLAVFTVAQVQFARGTARYRTWRELKRRPNDWASRSLVRESLQ